MHIEIIFLFLKRSYFKSIFENIYEAYLSGFLLWVYGYKKKQEKGKKIDQV
jgi:hypothetical protein